VTATDGARPDAGWLAEVIAAAVENVHAGGGPFAALLVREGTEVGRGANRVTLDNDPTAHAEVVAIREAAAATDNYRLTGATLYVTVEPCLMCVGAMVHARIETVVFGTTEPKAGALVSTQRAHEHPALNHRLAVIGGVLEDDCRAVLQEFFKDRRGGLKAEGLPKVESTQ
jgi:tRNA(adenine34) deaminase